MINIAMGDEVSRLRERGREREILCWYGNEPTYVARIRTWTQNRHGTWYFLKNEDTDATGDRPKIDK